MSQNKIYISDKSFKEREGYQQKKKSYRGTRYKAPEEFPQWKSPEDTFDMQQVMQEIMK